MDRSLCGSCCANLPITQYEVALWCTDEIQALNLAEFMGELCEQLRSSAKPGHTLTCDFASVMVQADQAVSRGLLANEFVTSAFKFA